MGRTPGGTCMPLTSLRLDLDPTVYSHTPTQEALHVKVYHHTIHHTNIIDVIIEANCESMTTFYITRNNV